MENCVILSLEKYDEFKSEESSLLKTQADLYKRINSLCETVDKLKAGQKLSDFLLSLLSSKLPIEMTDIQKYASVLAISNAASGKDTHFNLPDGTAVWITPEDIDHIFGLCDGADYSQTECMVKEMMSKYPNLLNSSDLVIGWIKERCRKYFPYSVDGLPF